MKIIKGVSARPRRVLLYGTHGIGKTTWAAGAPAPLFLCTEDGADDLGVDRTPLIRDMGEISLILAQLLNEQHDYRTIVIDSIDWLEKLIHNATASKMGKPSIEDIPYGKGYVLALKGWDWILSNLDQLRQQRGLNIVLLSHANITKYSPPDSDPYDRYSPDLHKTVGPMIQEWCDEVLFAKYSVQTILRDEGFGQQRARAIGSGERVVYTSEAPTHLAKHRLNMPDQIQLTWGDYQKYWSANVTPSAGSIAGIVTNGSSKKESVT